MTPQALQGLALPRWLHSGLVTLWITAAVVLLVAGAMTVAGATFLMLNRANPLQARPGSIAAYWQHYAGRPAQRSRLVASSGFAALLLLVVTGCAWAAARPKRQLHGDARFATPAEVSRAGLFAREDAGPGILVGRHGGRWLALHGQLSVMLSAPTRSGKGVGIVIPNLLQWPDSTVVLDIKGENYDVTAGYRAAHGQAVFAFSPFDDAACSHRWNPLTYVRTDAMHRVGDLLSIGQALFPNDASTTSSEAFFNDQARNLFLALGLFLLETPELPRSIGEMLRQASGKGRPVKDHLADAIEQRRAGDRALTPHCTEAIGRLLSNSENTLSSIVATFNAPLVCFADAVVDAATSADDFRLDELRHKRMSVYVRVPPNRLAQARPLLNLFFSQLISLNTRVLPQNDPSLKLQCLLVNDEFPALGRVTILVSSAAFLGGYNLRLLTVVQAMSQLDAVYGDKEARTFATNHGLQILFAPREQRDAEEYSAMLGHFTERAVSRGRSRSVGLHGGGTVSRNESEQRRALLLPQEFKTLGSERLVAVSEHCRPVLAHKVRYHNEPVFLKRLLPAPAVPAMDMDAHLARVEHRWRWVDDDVAVDTTFTIERLADDFATLPPIESEADDAQVDAWVCAFLDRTKVRSEANASGSHIEPGEAAVAEEPIQVPSDGGSR